MLIGVRVILVSMTASIKEYAKMAGTRTAPTVAIANITGSTTTLHLIDASGDLFTDAIKSADLQSDANVEAWASAYQAASQASLYKVTQTIEYQGDADPDNATFLARSSIAEGVNLLYNDPSTFNSQTPRLVAPIAAVMQGNQDIPLLTATEFTALLAALADVLANYDLKSAQFTGRRERSNNPRIKV